MPSALQPSHDHTALQIQIRGRLLAMPHFFRKRTSNNPPANELTSQSTQQSRLVCTWSAHAPQSGPGTLPFPRHTTNHTLTATSTGELFLFGGHVYGRESGDLYVFSTRDYSTTLLQTSGSVPTPRFAHRAALIDTTTLLICGGRTKDAESERQRGVLHHDSIYLLNLGTSDHLMTSLTSVDHAFALQNRESGPAFHQQLVCSDRAVVGPTPHPWSVPSSWSSVVGLTGREPVICGHSI